jgi:hypothetical protein
MIDVFVSRPTWVAPSFRHGLEGFLGLLSSLGLNPRTIGATDYPTKAPLDEVIRLMDRCAGAVILGYPQIIAVAGTIKDQVLSAPLVLPTEWNHIEAALAYARELPLLVIHHNGVFRGIFDRGAISRFIYELNLEDPAWPLLASVRGAIETWKRDVLQRPGAKKAPGDTVVIPTTREQSTLSDAHVDVLKFLAASDGHLAADDIAGHLRITVQKARYYLDGLVDAKYVGCSLAVGRPALYYLARAGRAVLVERGLL